MSVTDNQFQAYIEHMDDRFDAIIENFVPRFERIEGRLERVEENTSDLPALRTVVKQHSADIAELKAKTAQL